jgi:uncharacterized protein (TIGR03435 family)
LCVLGQTQPYEVATVKPAASDARGSGVSSSPEGRVSITNFTVERLIANAYEITLPALIEGLPAWAKTERYDIQATTSARVWPTIAEERRRLMEEMQRAILRDRFHLTFRTETKQVPVFLLTTDSTVKLKRSEDQSPPVSATPQPRDGSINRGGTLIGTGTMTARAVPLSRLAQVLTGRTERPVVDRTGLTGLFDFDLKWAPDPTQVTPGDTVPNVDAGSLFTALREQLGLKLTAGTGPAEVLVVEKVERPGEN